MKNPTSRNSPLESDRLIVKSLQIDDFTGEIPTRQSSTCDHRSPSPSGIPGRWEDENSETSHSLLISPKANKPTEIQSSDSGMQFILKRLSGKESEEDSSLADRESVPIDDSILVITSRKNRSSREKERRSLSPAKDRDRWSCSDTCSCISGRWEAENSDSCSILRKADEPKEKNDELQSTVTPHEPSDSGIQINPNWLSGKKSEDSSSLADLEHMRIGDSGLVISSTKNRLSRETERRNFVPSKSRDRHLLSLLCSWSYIPSETENSAGSYSRSISQKVDESKEEYKEIRSNVITPYEQSGLGIQFDPKRERGRQPAENSSLSDLESLRIDDSALVLASTKRRPLRDKARSVSPSKSRERRLLSLMCIWRDNRLEAENSDASRSQLILPDGVEPKEEFEGIKTDYDQSYSYIQSNLQRLSGKGSDGDDLGKTIQTQQVKIQSFKKFSSSLPSNASSGSQHVPPPDWFAFLHSTSSNSRSTINTGKNHQNILNEVDSTDSSEMPILGNDNATPPRKHKKKHRGKRSIGSKSLLDDRDWLVIPYRSRLVESHSHTVLHGGSHDTQD